MANEAHLEDVGSGLAPTTPGWFVVNARDAAWLNNDNFGGVCIFESDHVVLRQRPDLDEVTHAAGFTMRVMQPGQPSGGYHAESEQQEDFLVVAGECLLIIDGEERQLRTWDVVRIPPDVPHAFIGTGDTPSVIVATGNRTENSEITRPRNEVARRHGVEDKGRETWGPWKHERPPRWDELPWS
jgi:uncharacterized cupin superfamily protein